MDNSHRRTGRTEKAIIGAIEEVLSGEDVIFICHSHNQAKYHIWPRVIEKLKNYKYYASYIELRVNIFNRGSIRIIDKNHPCLRLDMGRFRGHDGPLFADHSVFEVEQVGGNVVIYPIETEHE